jgi:hypothetical protein
MSKLVTTPPSIPQEQNVKFIKLVNKTPSSGAPNTAPAATSTLSPSADPSNTKLTRRPGTGCIPVSGD